MDKICVYMCVLFIGALSGCQAFEVCSRTLFEITHYCDDNAYCCGNENLECCNTSLTQYAIVGVVLGCVAFVVLGVGLTIVAIKHIQLKRGTAMVIRE